MKIAIFTDVFYPYISGVVTATQQLAKGLADNSHEVHIITPRMRSKKSFTYSGVKVKTFASMPSGLYKDLRLSSPFDLGIMRYCKKHRIEIIHFHTPLSMGLSAIITAKKLKIPLVGTYHTNTCDKESLKNYHLDYSFMEKISWAYTKYFYDQADLVTSPSRITKKFLEEKNFSKPVTVVSNGIEIRSIKKSNIKKIRKTFGEEILLFVGRVAHEKSIHVILKSFNIISQHRAQTTLVIIGDGPQLKELKELAKKLNISDKVYFTGAIPHKKLMEEGWYAAAKIFMIASKVENQPITVLEAQAEGLVVVGVRARGMPDLVEHQVNGVLVGPDDYQMMAKEILQLLEDKQLYSQLQKNTRQRIKKERMPSVIKHWEQIYMQLLQQHHNRK